MKKLFFILLLVFPIVLLAQRGTQRRPLYQEGTAYQNKGWFIAPGITYMLPETRNQNLTAYTGEGDALDTLYTGDFKRAGKIGAYLEAGRHHFITESSLLHHIDYGVHFKMLRGRESFNGLAAAGAGYIPVMNDAKFSQSFAGAFFNASNIIQISNNKWIQNSIGVNVDYRIISRQVSEGNPYVNTWMFPDPLLAQLHYKIGFGWRPEPGIFIMPMLETPILTAFPWDGLKSTLPYFSGRSRPIILTVRIQWLSKRPSRGCENQPGHMSTKVDEKDPEKRGGNSLWGSEGKKMNRKRKKAK